MRCPLACVLGAAPIHHLENAPNQPQRRFKTPTLTVAPRANNRLEDISFSKPMGRYGPCFLHAHPSSHVAHYAAKSRFRVVPGAPYHRARLADSWAPVGPARPGRPATARSQRLSAVRRARRLLPGRVAR
eukprot:764217-Hanusia_phi.AAC.1